MGIGNKISRFFGVEAEEYDENTFPEEQAVNSEPVFATHGQKVVSITDKGRIGAEKKIALFEPRIYSDVKSIAGKLISDQAVVVNFQRMDDDQARRVVDFLTGTIFAINGEIQRIGDQIFLCTPRGFAVEGSLAGNFDNDEFS
ncbi:cell division protein SepF [Liquorilactobacillus nagelii]|jgi:cell division inhibitor SepF|uniref:cell division protein SepF n=1 Tax=Liquorilactobacillus nagelii TaxID=82688 RepID=UPI00242DA649|nr:cell division protein SepF [Liquorilactobacillus nagelii]MCI1699370.1 cell division protein SepF [Liquorilactobacillus nagelii]